jgi:hypothetical protein
MGRCQSACSLNAQLKRGRGFRTCGIRADGLGKDRRSAEHKKKKQNRGKDDFVGKTLTWEID